MRQIYARAKAEFTAADLQKFTEIEEDIPMERVLAEMEKINQGKSRKKKKR
jgi:hypothetical protein